MPPKYFGPCLIHNCNNDATKFHKLTPFVYKKAKEKGTLEYFQYLKEGQEYRCYQELCFKHYLELNSVCALSTKTRYKDFCIQVVDSNFFIQTNKENIDPTNTTFLKQVKILTSVYISNIKIM
ncbi:19530_t:CDS:2 [Gigaspora rosea]|nr:19530_t:CDS:2 [Gigaspora rosea]